MTTDTTSQLKPLTDAATAEEITAAIGAHRQAEEAARESAARDREEAEGLLAAAQAEAARIIGEAEAAARPLSEAAKLAEREAGALAERATRLGSALAAATRAEAGQAAADALEEERAELAAKIADLGNRLAALDGERREAETALAAARDDADLEAMTSPRNRLDSIRDLAGALSRQQAPLAARLAEIGDGHETFATHPLLRALPPLAQARQDAAGGRRTVRDALNWAWPDRPEAVRDREREELRLILEAQHQRIDEEAAAARRGPQRVSVDRTGLNTVIRRS